MKKNPSSSSSSSASLSRPPVIVVISSGSESEDDTKVAFVPKSAIVAKKEPPKTSTASKVSNRKRTQNKSGAEAKNATKRAAIAPGQLSIRNYFTNPKPKSEASVELVKTPNKSIIAPPTAIPTPPLNTNKPKRIAKTCPNYKVVEGTRFAVDAFQFGDIAGIRHYFLTHFHADHYVGLKKSFAYPLHVSPITARLVAEFVGVNAKYMHPHDINVPFVVDDVEIVALDANHCPGAVMFLFRLLSTGRCILHTGDFRASAEMEMYPAFWNHNIDTVYLDTTYMPTKAAFISQSSSLDAACRAVQTFLQPHPSASCTSSPDGRPIIVVGTYLIGKEKVWMSIAEAFDLNVWLEAQRHRTLACIYAPGHPIFKRIVTQPSAAQLHVLPLQRVTWPQLCEYRDQLEREFRAYASDPALKVRMLAVRSSGWEKDSSSTRRINRNAALSLIGVQYSEHSSHAELARFVRFLRPERVISTVPHGRDLHETPECPAAWMERRVRPMRESMQTNILSFVQLKQPK